jgi:hypothetical protein
MTTTPPNGIEPSDGTQGRRRGLTVTIIVLAILLVIAIVVVIWLLVASRGSANPSTPTPTPSATTTSASPRPTPTTTQTGTPALARCTVDMLKVTLGQPSGAAGSELVPILFTNSSAKPCELHGFPGVSFVGDGNGTQLGAAADEEGSVIQNTLQPGGTAAAPLKIAQAANFEGCQVTPADGLRVYPPHSFDAVFVKADGLSACSNADVHLLTVQSVQPQ